MYLADLVLSDFRSHQDVSVKFEPGVNILVGGNGQGKTNLVEAVVFLATLASHRVALNAALVRTGAERARVQAKLIRDGRAATAEVVISPGKGTAAKLGTSKVKPSALLGLTRVAAFAPEDLTLVKGTPAGRRRYLDEAITQLKPSMAGVFADYDKVVSQRTALLKTIRAERLTAAAGSLEGELEIWDQQVAALGGRITAQRMKLAEDLAPLVAAAYAELAGGSQAKMTYQPVVELPAGATPADVAEALLAAMVAGRREEVARGVSLFGPHREDLELELGELPARGYASHGESWSLALALKLGAFHLMRAESRDDPILILDDVFAELDTSRRQALATVAKDVEQVIVTAAVEQDVPPDLGGLRFQVTQGQVTPWNR
ncbi:MAG: DNA replication/repair protein RecF [Bifidobacteriaceae bacterium]|jgi:DNA replication and repair protein RecF|nr:DNA replication/repair protein RecF [Bifidobacteriaceae bacterium]